MVPTVSANWVLLITDATILVSDTAPPPQSMLTQRLMVSPWLMPAVDRTVIVVALALVAPLKVVATLGRSLVKVSLALVSAPDASTSGTGKVKTAIRAIKSSLE